MRLSTNLWGCSTCVTKPSVRSIVFSTSNTAIFTLVNLCRAHPNPHLQHGCNNTINKKATNHRLLPHLLGWSLASGRHCLQSMPDKTSLQVNFPLLLFLTARRMHRMRALRLVSLGVEWKRDVEDHTAECGSTISRGRPRDRHSRRAKTSSTSFARRGVSSSLVASHVAAMATLCIDQHSAGFAETKPPT